MPIPLFKVHMPENAIESAVATLRSGFIATGSRVAEFEKKFGNFIGNHRVVALNSCSSAIMLALHLAGIKKDDEVISTSLTCAAVNESILQSGARIVWADIDLTTGNIDPSSIVNKITSKTKAIVYSHWLGRLSDITTINQIASAHNLKTIEDAASALGGKHKGRFVGNGTADYTCFSFQAVKHITTGDGGVLALSNDRDLERAILLRNHGNDARFKRTPLSLGFDVYEAGWKLVMNDLAASIGLVQLDYLPIIIDKIRVNREVYERGLSNDSEISILSEYSDNQSNILAFTILSPKRSTLIDKLSDHNIGCSVVHMRCDEFSVFKSFKSNDLKNLDYFYANMINIPIGWWLESEQIIEISNILKS